MKKITREEAQTLAANRNLPAGPISFTQMETYLKCQRQYYLKYIAKAPMPFSLVMALGSAMHTGLEIMHKGLLADTSPRTPATLARHLESGLLAARSSIDLMIKKDEVDPRNYATIRRQGECLEELLKLWACDYLPEMNLTGAEEKFYCVIANTPINVRIDLLRKNRVSDFKLSKRDKSEKDAMNSLQLALYAIATDMTDTSFITLKYPVPDKIRTWYASITEAHVEKNPGDKKWAEEIIWAISKSLSTKPDLKSEYFPPCNPSDWLCSSDYCDAWGVCRGKPRVVTPKWFKSTTAF